MKDPKLQQKSKKYIASPNFFSQGSINENKNNKFRSDVSLGEQLNKIKKS